MGRKCSVDGCLSESSRPEDVGVTFHRVPLHPDVRPKWFSLCRIPDDKRASKVIHVCSRHFLRADFCNFKGKKYMLRQGVLPSVFPWDKSKLEAIKAEVKKESDDDGEERRAKHPEPPPRTPSSPSKLAAPSVSLSLDSKVEALDFSGEWYPARVVEVDYEDNEVLVHFDKSSRKKGEWIPMGSSRLRQPAGIDDEQQQQQTATATTFEAGERCLANWSDGRTFPATIMRPLKNGSYEVLFDDGFVKILKASKIVKSSESGSSVPFEPTQKRERKDRKRKHNVAELFNRRPRHQAGGEKRQKKVAEEAPVKPKEPVAVAPPVTPDHSQDDEEVVGEWAVQWRNGRPEGVASTLEYSDGPKPSVIVADPALPAGWTKHLIQRRQGTCPGKWDVVIVSPDLRKFRMKSDLKKYLDENPIGGGVDETAFDFSTTRKRRAAKKPAPKRPNPEPVEQPAAAAPKETPKKTEEAPDGSRPLKILFEDDSFKCPIDGCGKTFRRENLAQMHVKHYHPQYTRFLDSTPNVADLAYARTVGENLDKSPSSSKPAAPKPTPRSLGAPKTPKAVAEAPPPPASAPPAAEPEEAPSSKSKDSEIIKLLSSRPSFDGGAADRVQPLPPGLPTSMYPDIKLKDLLNRSESLPRRADLNLRTLCASRPPTGIKTLLPVVRADSGGRTPDEPPRASQPKRRREQPSQDVATSAAAVDVAPKGKPPPQAQAASSSSSSAVGGRRPTPPRPHLPPNDVIIEGGELIKIVKMKQEEIINCICGFTEEDGLMIQCELCLCWQHAYCNNIERECQVPERYVCKICLNPYRERSSRRYYHDQDWLKQGTLPVGGYKARDEAELRERFEKLRGCHNLSGGVVELRKYLHGLAIKLKIAEAKNHPKLYLWSKPWERRPLPEDRPSDVDSKSDDAVLMALLKDVKEEEPGSPEEETTEPPREAEPARPLIPKPEAAIDLDDCRLNLLEHVEHEERLVEARLDELERQVEALEAAVVVAGVERDEAAPRTRRALRAVSRDLRRLGELAECTTI